MDNDIAQHVNLLFQWTEGTGIVSLEEWVSKTGMEDLCVCVWKNMYTIETSNSRRIGWGKAALSGFISATESFQFWISIFFYKVVTNLFCALSLWCSLIRLRIRLHHKKNVKKWWILLKSTIYIYSIYIYIYIYTVYIQNILPYKASQSVYKLITFYFITVIYKVCIYKVNT